MLTHFTTLLLRSRIGTVVVSFKRTSLTGKNPTVNVLNLHLFH